MKQLIREAYTWEYTGEQPDRDEPVPLEEDDEEEIDLWFWFYFEYDLINFLKYWISFC